MASRRAQWSASRGDSCARGCAGVFVLYAVALPPALLGGALTLPASPHGRSFTKQHRHARAFTGALATALFFAAVALLGVAGLTVCGAFACVTLLHMAILANMFAVLLCDYDDGGGGGVMQRNPSQRCWTGSHWLYVGFACTVLFVFYPVGAPLMPTHLCALGRTHSHAPISPSARWPPPSSAERNAAARPPAHLSTASGARPLRAQAQGGRANLVPCAPRPRYYDHLYD